ncbi:NAD(P)-dependent alcohol dehydrogenase [Hyalangium versicolor]|uniref:NAD(P)-dependent alcohol dehydrogenase n=1 Tax=Hyalangium versicolor TaxID=2861190 RepID=UPI001CCFB610|nr:NAD(P)-dependent alcohol dehydrogenase [Hyalangium versicolor]
MSEMMTAAVLDRFGPPEVLHPAQVPIPAFDEQQVLVRVRASAVSPGDCQFRSGERRGGEVRFPALIGMDLAGEVARVGAAVTQWAPGDAVYGFWLNHGACSEYAVIPAQLLRPKPKNLSYTEAAAVPLSASTALQVLRDLGQTGPGQKVLVIGASGGVGTYAVQIARILGAEVTGVCSGRNAELVRELGAVQVIDYTTAGLTESSTRYDLILNTTQAHSYRACARHLRRGGTYLTTTLRGLRTLAESWLAKASGHSFRTGHVQPSGKDLEQLTDWIEAGKLRPVVSQVFPLPHTSEAHRLSETGHARGKLVITV